MGSLGGIERGLGHWHKLTTRVSRAAHRLTGSLSRSLRERIVHETSYLPFLFEADSAGPSSGEVSPNAARLRGRRVFNGRGQEIIQTEVRLPVSFHTTRSALSIHPTEKPRCG